MGMLCSLLTVAKIDGKSGVKEFIQQNEDSVVERVGGIGN
jgi:hypothetical protein